MYGKAMPMKNMSNYALNKGYHDGQLFIGTVIALSLMLQ